MNKDTIKRLVKQLGIGALIGGPIGFLVGYFGLLEKTVVVSETLLQDLAHLFGYLGLGLGLVLSGYLTVRVKHGVKQYLEVSEEEVDEDLYRQVNRHHGYAMVATGVSIIFAFLLLFFGYQVTVFDDSASLVIPIFGLLGLVIAIGLQMYLLKLYNSLRGIEMSLLPTVKELKNNVMQQDEAELQANYKMAFETVLDLSNIVIPTLYIVLFFLAQLTKQSPLMGFVVLATIHLYIMMKNIKMTREFYK